MLEKEAIEKGIDIESLKEEQKKLAKSVVLKDEADFTQATRFAAIHTETIEKEIIAAVALLNEDLEVIEEKYVSQHIRFPYIPGFRAYRELPAMIAAYDKLEEQPDVIFIEAQGISHPRGLGLASHFGVSVSKPVIGITNTILEGEVKDNQIILNKKAVAEIVVTKKGARPVYVSPGHMISLKTAVEMTKRCLKEPHKLPEPIVAARKTASNVRQELQK
jgi:deoxyribonuclease V